MSTRRERVKLLVQQTAQGPLYTAMSDDLYVQLAVKPLSFSGGAAVDFYFRPAMRRDALESFAQGVLARDGTLRLEEAFSEDGDPYSLPAAEDLEAFREHYGPWIDQLLAWHFAGLQPLEDDRTYAVSDAPAPPPVARANPRGAPKRGAARGGSRLNELGFLEQRRAGVGRDSVVVDWIEPASGHGYELERYYTPHPKGEIATLYFRRGVYAAPEGRARRWFMTERYPGVAASVPRGATAGEMPPGLLRAVTIREFELLARMLAAADAFDAARRGAR